MDDSREAVYSELFGETTVVTTRYKLTVNTETHEPTQLIDCRETPDESRNLVEDSGYQNTQEELIERFIEPLRARTDPVRMSNYREYVQRTGRLN